MIVGPWVSWWALRMKWYAQAEGISIPQTFSAMIPRWGRGKEILAIRIKEHAGVPNPDGRLDGTLRRIVKESIPAKAWEPVVVDCRFGKAGFAYKADGSWGGKRSMDGLFLVCHYTGGLASLKADALYHVNGHGWRGLSYHYAVERDGTLYWCNDVDDLTWHARGFNGKGIGLSFVGDDKGPTPEQARTLEWFIEKAKTTGIVGIGMPKVDLITRHGDAANVAPSYATSCPGAVGRELYKQWAGSAFTVRP